MKRILAAAALAALAACTTPDSPAQGVYAAESAYVAGAGVVVQYMKLAPCVAGGTPICRTAEVEAQVKKADSIAWTALINAEAAVRTPGFDKSAVSAAVASAEAAVKAFVSITDALKVR